MGETDTLHWNSIEDWSPTLFLVGGGLLVGHAVMLGVQAFSTLTTPPDVFGPAGHLVALVGLFGLYPTISSRTPTLARVAGGVATVAFGSWAVLTVTRLVAVSGLITSVSDVLPAVFFALMFGSTILTYTLFGVSFLRVDSSSRLVGVLLLAPAVLLVVVLVASAITGVSAVEGLVIGVGLAVSMVALGYTLRTWDRQTSPMVPTGDVSVR